MVNTLIVGIQSLTELKSATVQKQDQICSNGRILMAVCQLTLILLIGYSMREWLLISMSIIMEGISLAYKEWVLHNVVSVNDLSP